MVNAAVAQAVADGRAAHERAAWQEAYDALKGVEADLPAEGLSDLAAAANWLGLPDESLRVSEAAYHAYVAAGDHLGAGREALRLMREHRIVGHSSVGSAWRTTAERHLAGAEDCPEEALLIYVSAVEAFDESDWESTRERLDRVIDIATRHGDTSMVVRSRMLLGMLEVETGNADEGMRLLGEAGAAVGAGAVDPATAGAVMCNIIATCWDMADLRGATEWADSAQRWYEQFDVSVFPGICRVRKAEVKTLEGEWDRAETELMEAEEELKRYDIKGYLAEVKYALGDIRLLRGQVDEALELFQEANEMGREPLPGFALVAAARGDRASAITALRRALAEPRPRMQRSRVLVPLVDLLIDGDEVADAEACVAELEGLATECNSGAMRAWADTARGAVLAARGEAGEAIKTLDNAERLWEKMSVPYEAARTRVRRGLVRKALGDVTGAELDFSAARGIFSKLGAAPDLDRLERLLGKESPAVSGRRAVLVTDIVGSTKLVEALGDRAWTRLLAWHDRTLTGLIDEHGGDAVDRTGDGYLATFVDSETAVACAVAIQKALETHRVDSGFAPAVRIGIHEAEISSVDGSPAGSGVHLAARIGALADADQILVSRDVAEHLSNRSISGWREEPMKGFAEGVEVGELDWNGA